MKFILFSLGLLVLMLVTTSCGGSKEVTDPDVAYKRKLYSKAAELYTQRYDKLKEPVMKGKTAFLIAESYRMANDYSKAEGWYKEAVRDNYDPIAIYDYAEMLKAEEKYDEAIEQYKQYMEEEPTEKLAAKAGIKDCEDAKEWKAAKTNVTVYPITEINSNASDFGPVFYANNSLVFTSSRSGAVGDSKDGWTGNNYFDIYESEITDQAKYSAPKSFSDAINQSYNDGAVAFNKDFSVMYFTRCGTGSGHNDYCKLFKSTKLVDGGWGDPTEEKIFGDSVNVGQPCLNADGTLLVISANAEDAIGGKDLYYCYKTSEGWSSPINLGTEINTKGDEEFPSLDALGNLYFASDGHAGMGGLDIFSADKMTTGTKWTNVQNMKAPINSGADDFALITDKAPINNMTEKSGYFTSSRGGNDDIYRFIEEKKNFFDVEVLVEEKVYEDPNNPNSKITGYKPIPGTNVTLDKVVNGTNQNILTAQTDDQGTAHSDLEMDADYAVSATNQPCYLNASAVFTTKGKYDAKNPEVHMQVKIILDKIFTNISLNIPNIYYGYDSTNLRPESFPVIDSLIKTFKANPGVKIEIGSFTDCRGSDDYNIKLSQGRAESVVKYLVAHGLNGDDFVAKGYGETMPAVNCECEKCTEEEHAKNRRTTFTIIGAKQSGCENP